MREILFKAKRVDSQEWVEGDVYHPNTTDPLRHRYGEVHIHSHVDSTMYHVDPATVCQFTGIIDKFGKKIFEGDILRRERFVDWVVVHDDGAFKVYNDCNPSMFFYSENFDFDAREIIGNIHDKKEGE